MARGGMSSRNVVLMALGALVLSSCGGPRNTDDETPTGQAASSSNGSAAIPRGLDPSCQRLLDPVVVTTDTPTKGFPGAFGEDRRIETSDDVCGVADDNIEVAIGEILAATPGASRDRGARWDHRADPEGYAHVTRRLALDKNEIALLRRNGFVVSRHDSYPSYAYAYHEIYQSQLPIMVTVDSIFGAIYAGHDAIVGRAEQNTIAPLTLATLSKMHCQLGVFASFYPAELARDLDLYLTVALSLLQDRAVPSALGDASIDAEAALLAGKAHNGDELAQVTLFGRERMIDFTQYQPRGHYARADSKLQPYFRGAMWLSRLELNMVSRSSRSSSPEIDPAETPREVRVALALAEIAESAGVMADIALLDRTWALLAGAREDISLGQIAALASGAGIAGAADGDATARLIAAIGDDFGRTQRLHFTPEGVKELPAITTLLGPRVVADTTALLRLVADELPERYELGAADIAFALGHDRATTYLQGDLAEYPALATQLDKARADLVAIDPDAGDLYAAWLTAIREVASEPSGALPSFMDTEAYADLRMDTAITAYGQLRHNHVLVAGQGYDAYGCEIPDGFVEPAPAVYAALARYSALGETVMAELGATVASAYFARVGGIMRVLERISQHELTNQPLTPAQQRFLSMVVEMRPGDSGGGPAFTGWYFDLFEDRSGDGTKQADFIADYYTSTTAGTVSYIGAREPRLGAFVVDVAGQPRVVVGPVARGYEYTGSLTTRLDDEASMQLPDGDRVAPWTASYLLPTPAEPDMSIEFGYQAANGQISELREDERDVFVARVTARKSLGKLTLDVLDHHRNVVETATRSVGVGTTILRFPTPKKTAGKKTARKKTASATT